MPNSSDFNRFSVNPVNIDISRSMFNMDHSVKFSCNVGDVVPFDVVEVLPGDTFEVDTTKVVRLQPLVTPIMDEVIMDVYYFFVPNRLVWNHWVNFMGENTASAWTPTVEYNIPKLTLPENGFQKGTIADYMGVPTYMNDTGSREVNALPFRAYALICDQWFRSEAVMDPVHVYVDDTDRVGSNGNDQVTDIELGGKPFIACKYFDYFTSALPSPQRGDPVGLPIIDLGSSSASSAGLWKPVQTIRTSDSIYTDKSIYQPGKHLSSPNDTGVHFSYKTNSNNTYGFNAEQALKIEPNEGKLAVVQSTAGTNTSITGVFPDNLFVNFKSSDFSSISVNDLRTAFAIQKYLEKSARYGGRYVEHIKAFFNVDSPDARLQRSEYLGGSRVSLNINSVEANSSQGQPLGTVAGMSVTADQNSDFTKSFTEDGYLIGCAVLRYHHSYQQGLHRMWLRDSIYDFYNPVFANLGEQEIKAREIYSDANDSTVFGYQERWAEYRYQPNRVAGEFRSTSPTPLDMWHLGDYYDSIPQLSPSWLREDKTNLDRCLAVTSSVADQCLCDFYISMKATRAMPLYSIPGLIDHH